MARWMLLLMVVTACAHGVARLVHRDQFGGVIQLGSGRDAGDYAAADRIIADHCGPAGGDIVSEGEEVIGAKSTAFLSPNVRVARVREETAWRIHYQCHPGK